MCNEIGMVMFIIDVTGFSYGIIGNAIFNQIHKHHSWSCLLARKNMKDFLNMSQLIDSKSRQEICYAFLLSVGTGIMYNSKNKKQIRAGKKLSSEWKFLLRNITKLIFQHKFADSPLKQEGTFLWLRESQQSKVVQTNWIFFA